MNYLALTLEISRCAKSAFHLTTNPDLRYRNSLRSLVDSLCKNKSTYHRIPFHQPLYMYYDNVEIGEDSKLIHIYGVQQFGYTLGEIE